MPDKKTPNNEPLERVRIDKWLWAARFFKTRSLAALAVDGGRVKLNTLRVKPAKEVKVGDALVIHVGECEWVVTVLALSERRGPAPVARGLYEESAESCARRQAQTADKHLIVDPAAELRGRPTKRDRRRLGRVSE